MHTHTQVRKAHPMALMGYLLCPNLLVEWPDGSRDNRAWWKYVFNGVFDVLLYWSTHLWLWRLLEIDVFLPSKEDIMENRYESPCGIWVCVCVCMCVCVCGVCVCVCVAYVRLCVAYQCVFVWHISVCGKRKMHTQKCHTHGTLCVHLRVSFMRVYWL